MSNKGSEFERYISKFLTKWISGKNKPFFFWRSPSSGMLGTVYEENKHLKGDIIPIKSEVKEWWPFVIECKTGYPKTSFWQHFNNVKFGIEDFWTQALDQIYDNKQPILIYRKKGRKPIVGINKYIQRKLKKNIKDLNNITVCWGSKIQDCILYDMEEFFERITPDDIRKI